MAAPQTKAVCKAALVGLDEISASILRECFKQFRIVATDVTPNSNWVTEEKFDACVLKLEPGSEQLLDALRASRLNRHVVIYGVAPTGQLLRELSKYGINVMLSHPLDRQAALKVVRSTHLLVLHEFRRYVRLPVITEVTLEYERAKYQATSIELSGGGMSMATKSSFKTGQVVELSFALPNSKPLACSAVVSWLDPKEGSIGVRFEPTDERRTAIKRWIEDYLEI